MSIEGFDFDINNYDRTELLEILKLSDEVNINPTEVRVAAANMLSSLSNDKNLQEKEKIKVRSFLNKAVSKILFIEDDNNNELLSEDSITPSNAFKGLVNNNNKINNIQNEYEPTIKYSKNIYKPSIIKYADGPVTNNKEINEIIFGNKNNVQEVGGHFLIQGPKQLSGFSEKIQPDGKIDVGLSYSAPSSINPLRLPTINRGLNIDSRFRDNYYQTLSTDFIVTLPFRIKKCTSIQFSNLELPLTYYSFSRKLQNITFNVIITYTDGLIAKFICQIQEGNYGTIYDLGFGTNSARKGLDSEINSAMYAAGIDVANDLCFRVDTISGKSVFALPMDLSGVSYSNVKEFEIQFAVDNDGNVEQTENLQMRLGWQLGFRCATYKGGPSLTGAMGAAIVSEGIYFPRAPRYFLLALDDYNTSAVNDYFQPAFQSSIFPPNILTRLDIGPLRDAKGAYTLADSSGFVTQLNTTRTYFGPVTIEKLHITLYDEYGRIVDLNNMDWSFSLSCICVYD